LIIVPIISLFTKKQDQKELDDLFECYEEKTEAVAKEHLK
jgi:SSS family solute:Na+ symporter